jgi:hypothetical protein
VQTSEGAKFWAGVCAELANRGIQDVLIVCCDGLTGFPEAIAATWPQATVQTCVVHLIPSVRPPSLEWRPSRLEPPFSGWEAGARLIRSFFGLRTWQFGEEILLRWHRATTLLFSADHGRFRSSVVILVLACARRCLLRRPRRRRARPRRAGKHQT